LKRALQRYLLDEIAMALLDDKIQEGASISIDEQ
jgi:ATP-dependent Clp protease ATP-binding subunit ClpA